MEVTGTIVLFKKFKDISSDSEFSNFRVPTNRNLVFSGLINNELQAVHNFACRIIANGKKFDHITPILKYIGWLPVKEHLLFKDLVMIYKCINSLAPTYLCDLFLKRKELNNRATRNNEALHIPLFSTTTGQRSFRYRVVGLWNSLDNELKKLPLATFKIKLI